MTFWPPYAPDLNPGEVPVGLAWLKRHALANFCPDNLDDLNTTARAKPKECSAAPVDHRRLLGSGRPVMMSPFTESSIEPQALDLWSGRWVGLRVLDNSGLWLGFM